MEWLPAMGSFQSDHPDLSERQSAMAMQSWKGKQKINKTAESSQWLRDTPINQNPKQKTSSLHPSSLTALMERWPLRGFGETLWVKRPTYTHLRTEGCYSLDLKQNGWFTCYCRVAPTNSGLSYIHCDGEPSLWLSMRSDCHTRMRDPQLRVTPVWGTPKIGEALVCGAPWDWRITVGGCMRDACACEAFLKRRAVWRSAVIMVEFLHSDCHSNKAGALALWSGCGFGIP